MLGRQQAPDWNTKARVLISACVERSEGQLLTVLKYGFGKMNSFIE